MIATLILLYLILIYLFDIEKETAYRILLVYSLLNLLPLVALLLIYGLEHPAAAIIPILIGI